MSLHKFFENYLSETPELLVAQNPNDSNYQGLYNFYSSQNKRTTAQPFVDMLFYDPLTRCSGNPLEYELLRQKTIRLGERIQRDFDKTN